METFWKKLISVVLGLWMGLASAAFSVVGASRMDMLWQPAFFFWLTTMAVVALMLKVNWRQALLLLLSFVVASWVAFFVGMIFTGMYVIGGLLVTWALVKVMNLKAFRVLLFATGILAFIGLGLDLSAAASFVGAIGQAEGLQVDHGNEIAMELIVALAIWQTIMMTAITLQLYHERQHRQRLAAQAALESPADTSP